MTAIDTTGLDRLHAGASHPHRADARTGWDFPRIVLAEGLARLRVWAGNRAARRELATLSDRHLRDIGLRAADVDAERRRLALGTSIESLRLRSHL